MVTQLLTMTINPMDNLKYLMIRPLTPAPVNLQLIKPASIYITGLQYSPNQLNTP